MDKPKTTPKDFFLWAGAMVALYVSVFSLITLLFEYTNYAFPDALDYYVDPYSGSIRFAMASLIVLFPIFLLLMRLIRNDIVRSPEKRDLWIRRWALYLTVFVAGAAIAIDLITLINYFLGGDLTTRFALKVVIVLLGCRGGAPALSCRYVGLLGATSSARTDSGCRRGSAYPRIDCCRFLHYGFAQSNPSLPL